MKITEHTSNVLKLQNPPLGIGDILGCSLFTMVGLFTFSMGLGEVLSNPRETLTCERIEPTQITCELTSSNLLGKTSSQINYLESAEVISDDDTSNVILITRNRRISLADELFLGDVDKINAFIQNSEQASIQLQDIHWVTYLFGGVGLIFGIIFIFCPWLSIHTLPMSCFFDKNSDQLYLRYRRWMISSRTREEKLDAIKIAKFNEYTDSDGDKTYSIELLFESGESISLGSASLDPVANSGAVKADKAAANSEEEEAKKAAANEKVAKVINDFLGLVA